MMPASFLSDPSGSHAIVAAVAWLQATAIGTIALTIATLAVASVGFGMLTGRTDWRRGATVICGCFILLGAASVAAGMRAAAEGMGGMPLGPAVALAEPPLPTKVETPLPPDPYAGASILR